MTNLTPNPDSIRLLVTDMDGTFLGRDRLPSPANREAVLRAADLGVPTIFATGRPRRSLQPLDSVRGAHPLVITSNGGLILDLDHDQVVHSFPLDPDVTAEVIKDVRTKIPHACFAVEYIDGWGMEEHYPYPEGFDIPKPRIGPGEELVSHDETVKLLIQSGAPTLELMAEIEPIVADRMNPTVSILSDSGFVELSHPSVTKGDTLRFLLGELDILPENVVAFGDMPNDLTMLELVGYPFVVENGSDLLKERGFPVCGHHDDSAFATIVSSLLGF